MFRVVCTKSNITALSNIFCSSDKRGPENCIDINSTGASFYDDLLDDSQKAYFAKNKNLEGHIEYMTPEEYYEACAKMFGSSVSSLKQQRQRDKDSIEWLTNALESGRKFNLPYVNFAQSGQEGLHRMMVIANKYGWDEYTFPVLVVNYVDERRNEVEQAYKYLDRSINKSLEYAFSPNNLPDDFIDQVQWELADLCDGEDFEYKCICTHVEDNAGFVLSIDGFESEVQITVYFEDIRIRETDPDLDNLDLDDPDWDDLLDDIDFSDVESVLKSLRK